LGLVGSTATFAPMTEALFADVGLVDVGLAEVGLEVVGLTAGFKKLLLPVALCGVAACLFSSSSFFFYANVDLAIAGFGLATTDFYPTPLAAVPGLVGAIF